MHATTVVVMDVAPASSRALTTGQRTRERLLSAAVSRFGDDGYRATSVSQISRDAGLTPAAAYAYFEDKDALWVAAVQADLDELSDEITDAAMADAQPIFALLRGLLLGLERHPLVRRVLAEGDLGDLQVVLDHPLFSGTTERLIDTFVARKAAGVLAPDADPEVLARGLETIFLSLIVSSVRAGMLADAERVRAVIEVLRSAVGGGASQP